MKSFLFFWIFSSWILFFPIISVRSFSFHHHHPSIRTASSLSPPFYKQQRRFLSTSRWQQAVVASASEVSAEEENDSMVHNNVTIGDTIQSYLTSLSQDHYNAKHDSITSIDKVVMTTSAMSFAIGFILLVSRGGGWRYYLAGGLCAAISHAVATPIDVVKTRKQVDPNLVNQKFFQATRTIVQTEGVRTLLAGFGPTTFGYLLEGSLKFGIYEILKPTMAKIIVFQNALLLRLIGCGAISGLVASIVLCPMEAIRIRMVSEPEQFQKNSSWIQGGYQMLKQEGVSALWKGLPPMLYKQVPYTISKNVAFDVLTKLGYSLIVGSTATTTVGAKLLWIPFTCALLTSVLATLFSQPGDVLLSLVNAHEGNRQRTRHMISDIFKASGPAGFFIGTKTRFLHVGIIVTMQLMLYDIIKRMVGIAATGSV